MAYSFLCPKPNKDETQQESLSAKVPMNAQQSPLPEQVIVETVTDEEETDDLLPATADTLQNARKPPSCGVIYMFPRAWKERTTLRKAQSTDETENGSYYSQYCTIS